LKEFLIFLNNNNGLIALFNLFASVILVCVYIGIFKITKRYVNAANELAKSSVESVEATKNIEKDRLTYELIKEWQEDIKFLTSKRLGLKISRQSANLMLDIENKEEFIKHLDNFFDYFLRVYKLIDDRKINKDLYFKILGREIVKFKYDQLEENTDISVDVRRKLREQEIDLPIVSDREWFDKIFKIAKEEYKLDM